MAKRKHIQEVFGAELRRWMKNNNKTQRDLELDTRLARGTVRRLVEGDPTQTVTLNTLDQFTKALGVQIRMTFDKAS